MPSLPYKVRCYYAANVKHNAYRPLPWRANNSTGVEMWFQAYLISDSAAFCTAGICRTRALDSASLLKSIHNDINGAVVPEAYIAMSEASCLAGCKPKVHPNRTAMSTCPICKIQYAYRSNICTSEVAHDN